MEPRSLKYIAEACGGQLLQGDNDALVSRICTDSRQAESGDLFVALAGERFDGHEFLGEAIQKGATAVIVECNKLRGHIDGCALIAVDKTRQAFGRLAHRYRSDFDLPIIAVGGSNGKTTTKELLAAVLSQKYRTLSSQASYNNDIGVPLTLLSLQRTHEVAVLEAGTNHPGELAILVRMINPRYGVITGIGREHLEFFGDLSGVAEEEGWLAELLPADGVLFVNGDCPYLDRLIRRSRSRVRTTGLGQANDWRARWIELDLAGSDFEAAGPEAAGSGRYRLNLLGRHQVSNAIMAVAVGAEFGLSREEIRRGLANCMSLKSRMECWRANGVIILDDAYNANADSMIAALETLRDLPCAGRRVAVLGDMMELGLHSEQSHAEVGRRAVELGVEALFAVGKMAAVVGGAARAAGLATVRELASVASAETAVKDFLRPGDLVLIKASHATGLGRLADFTRQ